MPERGLNIGSGQRPFKSTPDMHWINIDSQGKWSPDLVCNAEKLPFDEGTVEYVVLHHVLEHFGCGEATSLIREAHRVLRQEGKLLVFVPDMKALARRWLNGFVLGTQVYMTNVYGAYMGDEADRHKWGYTPETLHEFLAHCAPWTDLRIGGHSLELPGADIAHDWWILEAEAIK